MTEFIYPYNFVELRNNINRDGKYLSHSTFRHLIDGKDTVSLSGKLECSLDIKTPLFIRESITMEQLEKHKRGVWDFYNIGGEYVIPPTSLKGMVRSVIEAMTDSCLSQLEGKYGSINLREFLYNPCVSLKDLCFVCKMFGVVSEGKNTEALAGKVNFTFGKPDGQLEMIWLKDSEKAYSATPKADKATKLYFKNKLPKGRKFYWHHSGWQNLMSEMSCDEIKSDRFTITEEELKDGRGVYHVIKSGKFKFDVDYYNLNGLELYSLLYALELGEGMWHKLGKGKSCGLGSIKITVDKQREINREDRYRKGILEKADSYRENFDIFKKAVISKLSKSLSKYSDFQDLQYILKANSGRGLVIKGKEYPICYPPIETGKNWFKAGMLPSIKEIKSGTVSSLAEPYKKHV